MKNDVTARYSLAFKQQVVSEVESGKLTIRSASKMYDLAEMSVYHWLRKFGQGRVIRRMVRVETPDEVNRLKEMERRNKELESALAKTQVKVLALEALIEVAEEHYKTDFKKNFGPKPSDEFSSGKPPSA